MSEAKVHGGLPPWLTWIPHTHPPPRVHSSPTWPKADLDVLSTQWRDLLMTAGFQTSIYNIDGDRLLVSVQKGWNGEDVKNFFLTRTEVDMVTWNNVETRTSEFAEF